MSRGHPRMRRCLRACGLWCIATACIKYASDQQIFLHSSSRHTPCAHGSPRMHGTFCACSSRSAAALTSLEKHPKPPSCAPTTTRPPVLGRRKDGDAHYTEYPTNGVHHVM
ncbi:hypothetical protein B0H17DRAFT_1073455 [Mycena rosella]|uniref:Secreted protein n=1 Tax=Mycena rosella TaxID=1033263 RepID=A0AAD7D8Z0_MYCRO|nr:hypothetical protein B0H17DRAFT_1073455 [Mycena rosella]